jgi:hypothetical protein
MQTRSLTNPLPAFFVGKDVTSDRIGNYASKHTLLSNDLGKPDTRSVWYSKEHITKLLEEIELAEGDGLRVFFGAYEDTHEDYSGQTCLLMVVTREHQEGEVITHQNVIMEDEPGFSARGALPRGAASYTNHGFGRGKDYNHGSPCPPLCDGDEGVDFP